MRKFLLALVALGSAAWLGTSPSEAYYHGRWCATVAIGNGSVREICHFNDFATCAAEVVSGNRGFCGPNPYWTNQAPGLSRKRR